MAQISRDALWGLTRHTNLNLPRVLRVQCETMNLARNSLLLLLAIVVTVALLKAVLGPYGIIFPVLYIFFDVNGCIRVAWIALKKRFPFLRGETDGFLEASEMTFFVLPSDVDLHLHMNNAR